MAALNGKHTHENKFSQSLQLNADRTFTKPLLPFCALLPIHCNPFVSCYKLWVIGSTVWWTTNSLTTHPRKDKATFT